MNRKPRFIIVIAAAILTFGTLMATVGPRFRHCHRIELANDHCADAHHCKDNFKDKEQTVQKQEGKPNTKTK